MSIQEYHALFLFLFFLRSLNQPLQWNSKWRFTKVVLLCPWWLSRTASKFPCAFQWQAFRTLQGNYSSWCFYTKWRIQLVNSRLTLIAHLILDNPNSQQDFQRETIDLLSLYLKPTTCKSYDKVYGEFISEARQGDKE